MDTKTQLFKNIFTSPYSSDNFKSFVSEFFNEVTWVLGEQRKDYWNWSEFSVFVEGYTHVATYTGSDNNTISVFAVEMKKGQNIDRARSAQRNFVKKLIESGGSQAAIVAFYSIDEFSKWRLSFVKLDYEFSAGKLKQKITPAKRYSYLVGKGEPCHTAQVRLLTILRNETTNPTLAEMEEAFSVEKITKEFFEQYKEKYIRLKEYLESKAEFLEEADKHNFTSEQFSKKLMGQIAFLYFVQKKGWLGVRALPRVLTEKEYKNAYYAIASSRREVIVKAYKQTSENEFKIVGSEVENLSPEDDELLAKAVKGEPWGTGPRDFMRELYKDCIKKGKNYFDDYLEPLFYEALNKSRGDIAYYPRLHCKVPFLNGGLFEPLENFDWENNAFNIPNEMFSNKDEKGEWDADGILDIFDRYNFTMNEDEPLEKEVAVDPEMLGKIFENLLDVKDRKSKGAFYTPREIVHYMCQESIVNYLVNETGLPYDDLKDFILYGEFMKDEDTTREVKAGVAEMYISKSIFDIPSGVNRLADIDKALANIKVCDPAVGSGAFPLGMINEIVKARTNITAYLALLEPNKQNRLIMHKGTRHPYKLKLDTIKNCIYAVDIEPSAVDITKLRLWLSLVVDEETDENAEELSFFVASKNPKPLPNLDCNIRCGNSLIDELNGVKLINESDLFGNQEFQVGWSQNIYDEMLKELFDAQDKLFSEKDHDNKESLKKKIRAINEQIIMLNIKATSVEETYHKVKNNPSLPYFLWQLEFARVFKEKGGFDVVIGNPPYIGFHNVPNKEYFNNTYFVANGKYDFYVLFIERGLQLIRQKGFLSFICPSYFYIRNYGKNTRKLLLDSTTIKFIADFKDYQIFDSALTYTCIFGAEKTRSQSTKLRVLGVNLNNDSSYLIEQNELKEPVWSLEKKSSNEIVSKILAMSSLKFADITKSISQGIVTGNNDVYLINEETIIDKHIEMDYLKKAYKGREIKAGQLLNSHQYIFYPYYETDSGKTVCIKEEILQQKCPNLYSYLTAYKSTLLSREYFLKSNKEWYELWNPRKVSHFFNRKFVFAEISLYNDFVLVDECFYTDSACGAELKENYKKFETFLLLYLNSKLSTYIYKKVSVPKANGYSIYKNAFLKGLPIILPAEQSSLCSFKNMEQKEFNQYLYKIVNLTEEEIKIVEESVK